MVAQTAFDFELEVFYPTAYKSYFITNLENRGLNQWAGKARGGEMASVYGDTNDIFLA